ncbi:MAG: hypothetical protein ACJ70Q_06470 [Nitrososphaera sp.]
MNPEKVVLKLALVAAKCTDKCIALKWSEAHSCVADASVLAYCLPGDYIFIAILNVLM